ncbi:MAG: helix-turn-helix domain-containing protein [Bacteroidetes bacterium]|nr:helix-turn-helix domain-containing protein [Bacteroidota bacterium]
MITGIQIRAARGILRWTLKDLAEASRVSLPTVQRIELQDGVPNTKAQTLIDIRDALVKAGIEFIGTPENGPGVKIKNIKEQ